MNRYVLDKQTGTLMASKSNSEQWNTVPTVDPDKILLMEYAYEVIFGVVNPEHYAQLLTILNYKKGKEEAKIQTENKIRTQIRDPQAQALSLGIQALTERLLDVPGLNITYGDKVYPGWFVIGKKHDVPKCACYVGHCGDTYAWVLPEHAVDLANFALAILDIATFQTSSNAGGRSRNAFFGAGFSLFSPQQ